MPTREYTIVTERKEADGPISHYKKYNFPNEEIVIPIVRGNEEEEKVMDYLKRIMADNNKIQRLETKVEEFS